MAIGRLLGRGRRKSRKEPDYVRTLPYDGRKEVDFDKFFKDPRVKNQIKRVREEVIEPQRKRAQGRG